MPDDTFDWVRELHACSVQDKFAELRIAAERNAATRNAHFPDPGTGVRTRFGVNTISHRPLVFLVFDNWAQRKVEFSARQNTIKFHRDGDGARDYVMTLTLDEEGKCKFLLDGKELDIWQVLKLALEPLFFPADDE
jgi:hypothetical protein